MASHDNLRSRIWRVTKPDSPEPTRPAKPSIVNPLTIMLVRSAPDLKRVQSSPGRMTYAPMNRDDAPPIDFALPFDWAGDRPATDRNWHGQLHMWRMLDPYLLLYYDTGNADYLTPAFAVASDWLRYHSVEGKNTTFSWRDGLVGLRAMKIAALWEARSLLQESTQTLSALDALWLSHVDWATEPGHIRNNNHGLIDLHGAMALAAVRPDHPKSLPLKEHLSRAVGAILNSQFDEHGVHREHSPEYHFFAMRYFGMLLASQWYEDVPDVQLFAEKSLDVAKWFKLPDGRYLPFGDSAAAPPVNMRSTAVQPDTSFATFDRSGYVVHRSSFGVPPERASYLAFMGCFQSLTHKHADDLSLVWHEGGIDILADSGKFAYADTADARYFRSSAAHNVIQIDAEDRAILKADAYGSAVKSVVNHPWGIEINAAVVFKKSDVSQWRTVLFSPGHALVVIDSLSSNAAHQYASRFHLAPEIVKLSGGALGPVATLPNGDDLSMFFRTDTANCELAAMRGQDMPTMSGWASRGYASKVPCWTLDFRPSATPNVNIAAAFVLPTCEFRKMGFTGGNVEIDIGPIRHLLLLKEREMPVAKSTRSPKAVCYYCEGTGRVASMYASGEYEACVACDGTGNANPKPRTAPASH